MHEILIMFILRYWLRARVFVAVLAIAPEGRPFLTEIPFAFFLIELIWQKIQQAIKH